MDFPKLFAAVRDDPYSRGWGSMTDAEVAADGSIKRNDGDLEVGYVELAALLLDADAETARDTTTRLLESLDAKEGSDALIKWIADSLRGSATINLNSPLVTTILDELAADADASVTLTSDDATRIKALKENLWSDWERLEINGLPHEKDIARVRGWI